jgi:ABC-type phosphate transport system substrate-binding protein
MVSNMTRIGVSASALLLASLGASTASAAITTTYGAGASLPAPYFRQAADCFGTTEKLLFSGTPPTSSPVRAFNYTGAESQNCATEKATDDVRIKYMSTGSGTGIRGFFSHDPAQVGDVSSASGIQNFPSFDYGLSETALGATEVGYYNNGNTEVAGGGSVAVTVVAPRATPAAGQYKNPRTNYGALIQVPLLIAPVTIAFDPVYKKVRQADGTVKSYSFNLAFKRADGSGGLRLSQEVVCAIFNGDIRNWNDKRLTALNGGKSLQSTSDRSTFSVPMQIVGREDSSGTSSLWTRFLAKACENYDGNSYIDSTSRLPGTYTDSSGTTRTTATGNKDLAGAFYQKANSNAPVSGERTGTYTLANGNDGVAKYVDFTREPGSAEQSSVVQGRIGYLGPDYALPAVLFTATNRYNLMTADVENRAGNFVAPTATAALASFGSILPPDTDSKGAYKPSSDGSSRSRSNPQDWVEPAKKTSPLANPSASNGYPILGTSNFLGYTCYKSKTTRSAVQRFQRYFAANPTVVDPKLGILAKSGFAAMPEAWQTAIERSFFDGKDPDNLDLTVATAKSGNQCPTNIPGA